MDGILDEGEMRPIDQGHAIEQEKAFHAARLRGGRQGVQPMSAGLPLPCDPRAFLQCAFSILKGPCSVPDRRYMFQWLVLNLWILPFCSKRFWSSGDSVLSSSRADTMVKE